VVEDVETTKRREVLLTRSTRFDYHFLTTPRVQYPVGRPRGVALFCGREKAMENRTIVYVDGFNLYYGALKHSNYRWLNLQRYF